ncbi:MAG TPA: glycosyltransferase family 39 protein [Ktedonobacterales bacterium]|nr:glycosyltransferase family 39 protein [Ktedonobacterales bacterium]
MRETQAEGAAEGVSAQSAATAESDAPESIVFGWRWADALLDWAWRHPRLPLMISLIAGVLARLVLVIRSNALIDGDEAMVGIQAERILRGDFPTYFYGQAYMGSLETYLIAALFRLFGPSAWAMRAVPILLSLLLVYLTWRLAYALLPRDSRATPLLAGLAALFAAVPPLYDAVTELRTWGGQIEVYVIILALLLATVELAQRLRDGATTAELARRWAIWGFLAGLGIWVNPLIIYALITAILWLAFPYARRAFPRLVARLRRDDDAPGETSVAIQPAYALTLLAVIPGLLVGGLPAWVYALQHSGENLLVYLTQPPVSPAVSGAARQGRLVLAAAITTHYAGCIAPQVFNGMMPAEPVLYWLPLRLLLLVPPLVGILCSIWLLRRGKAGGGGWQVRAGLPLFFVAVITVVFCLGTSAWAASKNCEYDLAGRYAVPLALVEPFLLLALFALPFAWPAVRRLLRRPARPLNQRMLTRGWQIALLALLLGGAIQFGTYFASDMQAAFQSPFYRFIRQDQSQLYDYLQTHNIHYAWCNHWLGNIVTFRTDGETVCADYYDQVVKGGIQRPPGTLQTVSQADRPSFIIARVNPHPILAQELDAQGIPYTIAVLPQAGVTIITPARAVDPATVIAGLAQDYGANQ